MYALRRFGIKLGLETIKNILQGLGSPQDKFASIHIAGTNGKGSVASALATVLHRSGYRVGLYTSPHLVRFNERIRINNRQIANRDVIDAFHAIHRVHTGDREPTFFEFTTAMALYEFARKKVDFAVIETGMGGRLDATNIITPQLSVITNISVEHKEYLGNTLSAIAREKAGIIKESIPVVTAIRQKQAYDVLKSIGSKKSAPLYRLGHDFKVRRDKHGSNSFTYVGLEHTWPNLETGLRGSYQVENAALVLAASELLNKSGAALSFADIKAGLKANKWPGRLEIVSNDPLVILDGAHNFIAARNLGKYISNNLSRHKITFVIGVLDDKPYASILKSLLPRGQRAIFCQAKTGRALPPQKLLSSSADLISNTKIIPDVGEALKYAIETSKPGEAVCVAGSLYVVGEAKEAISKGLLKNIKAGK